MEKIEKLTGWLLKDLLADPVDQALAETFEKLDQALAGLEALRDSLGPEISISEFKRVLAGVESVNRLTSRLEAYSDLLLTEDTQSPFALNLRDRINEVLRSEERRVGKE